MYSLVLSKFPLCVTSLGEQTPLLLLAMTLTYFSEIFKVEICAGPSLPYTGVYYEYIYLPINMSHVLQLRIHH